MMWRCLGFKDTLKVRMKYVYACKNISAYYYKPMSLKEEQ